MLFAVMALTLGLLWDGRLGRLDGVILLAAAGAAAAAALERFLP